MVQGVKMMARTRENLGRYARIHDAIHPGPDLPRARAHQQIRIAAVPDPMPVLDSKRPPRQKVAVNIKTDALETEYSYGRISEGAYFAGRTYQYVLEVARGRTSNGCSFEPKDRANPATAHEWAIIAGLERAQDAVDLIYETRKAVGQYAELLLSDILGQGATIGQAAIARGYESTWGRKKVAGEFREALEGLAKSFDRA